MENFNEIINGTKPTLVDFYATWCGPCKMMHPVIEELGSELKGDARILKIDIDKNEALANKYRIQAVPTFVIFQKSEIKWRHSGMIDKSTLIEEVKKLI